MSLPPGPASGFTFSAALPYFTAVLTAAVAWFAAQSTAAAQLQKILFDASRELILETQKQRAQDAARILELESINLQDRGEINQLLQTVKSQQNMIDRLNKELAKLKGEDGASGI
jgi:hypothetical protein